MSNNIDQSKPIIKTKDLDVIYFLGKSNEVRALEDINIEIYPGEFIIFFGPSGCGKSTLLYSMAGLETNIQGNIFIGDKDLSKFTNKELESFHQKKIGMIFQAFYLINSLTVLGNVVLPQIFVNGKKKEREANSYKLLEYFGVKEQAKKLPSNLSGGQQQRVAICRALINEPSILMADEPVGNLDSTSSEEVMKLLKELNQKSKKTIILVTHNPAYLGFAHRVFYMKDGRIINTKVNEVISDVVKEKLYEEKKGEETSISKELELLARSYSNITESDTGNLLIPFKAKQIVTEALTGMTSDEISRIEKKVEKLIMMNVNGKEEIYKFLDIGAEQGGLGMDQRTAEKLATKIYNIIKEIELIVQEEEKIKSRKIIDTSEEIVIIRRYLMEVFGVEIVSTNALRILDKIIEQRIKNEIDRQAFQKKLDLPIKDGGVGLDKRKVKKVAQRLELLILGKYK